MTSELEDTIIQYSDSSSSALGLISKICILLSIVDSSASWIVISKSHNLANASKLYCNFVNSIFYMTVSVEYRASDTIR